MTANAVAKVERNHVSKQKRGRPTEGLQLNNKKCSFYKCTSVTYKSYLLGHLNLRDDSSSNIISEAGCVTDAEGVRSWREKTIHLFVF